MVPLYFYEQQPNVLHTLCANVAVRLGITTTEWGDGRGWWVSGAR